MTGTRPRGPSETFSRALKRSDVPSGARDRSAPTPPSGTPRPPLGLAACEEGQQRSTLFYYYVDDLCSTCATELTWDRKQPPRQTPPHPYHAPPPTPQLSAEGQGEPSGERGGSDATVGGGGGGVAGVGARATVSGPWDTRFRDEARELRFAGWERRVNDLLESNAFDSSTNTKHNR